MAWMTAKEAAAHLGIAERTVNQRGAAGDIKTRPAPHRNHRAMDYWVDDGTPGKQDPVSVREKKRAEGRMSVNGKYYVDEDRGMHVFWLKSRREPLAVPSDDIHAMVAAYTKNGGGATQNELARRFKMTRGQVQTILKLLSVTKDGSGFTDEAIADTPVDELSEEIVRLKEQEAIVNAEARSWRDIKKKALDYDIKKHFADRLLQMDPKTPPRPKLVKLSKKADPFIAVIPPSDFHFGKQGWADDDGAGYTKDIAAKRLEEKTELLLQDAMRRGSPEKIVIPVGSDWFHSDSSHHTTTGKSATTGTPQDMNGNYLEMIREGIELKTRMIQMCRQVAPVKLIQMAGNHDHDSSHMLMMLFGEKWRDAKDVDAHYDPYPRQLMIYGNSALCFDHGDTSGTNPWAMAKTIVNRFRSEFWKPLGGVDNHYAFHGHIHTAGISEVDGALVFSLPSLAGSDRWHVRNGYTSNTKALSGIYIDREAGFSGMDYRAVRRKSKEPTC